MFICCTSIQCPINYHIRVSKIGTTLLRTDVHYHQVLHNHLNILVKQPGEVEPLLGDEDVDGLWLAALLGPEAALERNLIGVGKCKLGIREFRTVKLMHAGIFGCQSRSLSFWFSSSAASIVSFSTSSGCSVWSSSCPLGLTV